jgi:hypothetical protein
MVVAAIPEWPDMREIFIPGDEIMIVFTSERMRKSASLTRRSQADGGRIRERLADARSSAWA